ncbi:spore coat protein F [Paenibacillus sp. yr247]|uniref:spore coat protein n=1 Tax=Paenibacillus sp. yr247 TaxID=1761880 RepID=UPI00087DFD98|nr:spore coat protein [Paenibacillus sp. yr247]SDN51941.1 spore coat protein F [Paenibacillus sp. yr247]
MYSNLKQPQHHLALHETLQLHETVGYLSGHLIELKRQIRSVQDLALRALYVEAIQVTDMDLRELLLFYPMAPTPFRDDRVQEMPEFMGKEGDMTGFHGGKLLAYFKSSIRAYAIPLTESATPQLRDAFQRHMNRVIHMYGKVSNYMLERGYYPAYDLGRLLAMDVAHAQKALDM